MKEFRRVCITNSGMWGIWDIDSFKKIKNYDSWENEFGSDDDILKQVKECKFVPINIHSDGSYEFLIRVNEKDIDLTDRERKYLLVNSYKYVLETKGKIGYGGIEFVEGKDNENIGYFEVPKGKYEVITYLIDWKKEPGSLEENGNPSQNALPDFIITLKKTKENKQTSNSFETFPR